MKLILFVRSKSLQYIVVGRLSNSLFIFYSHPPQSFSNLLSGYSNSSINYSSHSSFPTIIVYALVNTHPHFISNTHHDFPTHSKFVVLHFQTHCLSFVIYSSSDSFLFLIPHILNQILPMFCSLSTFQLWLLLLLPRFHCLAFTVSISFLFLFFPPYPI